MLFTLALNSPWVFQFTAPDTPFPSLNRCPSSSHQQRHSNRSPYKAHRQTSIRPKNIVPPKPHQKAIPFSLFLRIRRICSTDPFFDRRSRELIKYLTKRGYSRTSLQKDANRVSSIPRQPLHHKNRNPQRLTEQPFSHLSTLRFLKYYLLPTSTPLYFKSLPTAKTPSLTHHL